MAIHDAMEHIKENLTKIEWPFLVLHGDADQLTMVDGSVMLEEKAASQDKTIKVTFLGCLTYIVILWKSAQFASINSKLQHSPPGYLNFLKIGLVKFSPAPPPPQKLRPNAPPKIIIDRFSVCSTNVGEVSKVSKFLVLLRSFFAGKHHFRMWNLSFWAIHS